MFPSFPWLIRRPSRPALLLLVTACLLTGACASIGPTPTPAFDSVAYLRDEYAKRLDAERARTVPVPFELKGDVLTTIDEKVRPAGDTRTRVRRIIDYVFTGLELDYALAPTRDANATFRARAGNCLSFVNLFVAIGRHVRLDPFYVEVEDYQRWDHRQGMVVSQGHIVGGLYVDGELQTYDFLPYRVKSYRDFEPIDDLTAAAHYFNNLGAEALLDGDLYGAYQHLEIAARIDPSFVKAANNLGVWYARNDRFVEAEETLRRALEVEPLNVPLLTNLARVYQRTGRSAEADALLDQVEGMRHENPFFFVYRGDLALSRGDHGKALEYMRDALRIDTEVPEVHLGLARVYVALGELDKVKHHIGRALELDPQHPDGLRMARMLAPGLAAAGGSP